MKRKLYTALFYIFIAIALMSLTMLGYSYYEYIQGDEIYAEAQESFVTVTTPAPKSSAKSPTSPSPTAATAAPEASQQPQTDETEPPSEQPEETPTPTPEPEVILTADFPRLAEINQDIFGWIYVPGTKINYPLLVGVDNSKYLNTTYDGRRSKFGSIFIDKENSSDMTDKHTIIYGHNINGSSMFGDLRKFNMQDFADRNSYIYITLPDKKLQYQIVSTHLTDTTEGAFIRSFTSDSQLKNFIDFVNKKSSVRVTRTAAVDDTIITLSTCTSPNKKEQRFVVHAVLVGEELN